MSNSAGTVVWAFEDHGASGVRGEGAVAATGKDTNPVVSVRIVTSDDAFARRMRVGLVGTRGLALDARTPQTRLVPHDGLHVLVLGGELLEDGHIAPVEARQLSKAGVRLLLLLQRNDESALRLSLLARAHGCIHPGVSADGFRRAVEAVAQGDFWFPRWMMEPLYRMALSNARREIEAPAGGTRNARAHELTLREIDVMRLARQGLTNKQIAQELAISPNTVKKHLHNALVKHGIQRRRQLFR